HTTATTPVSTTGLSPSTVRHPHLFVYQHHPPRCTAAQHMRTQQPPPRNPCRVSHVIGLASSAFARHYYQNHHCFLFLQVLRCFTSPRSLQLAYTFNQRSHTKPKQCMRGFPIRTSWPHRLVINSTRLIADSHVLHRLLLPRHPPCALTNLPNQQPHKTGPS